MNGPLNPACAEVERVLIYRLGSLGDNVVALPSYHQIARAFPRAERRLLTNIPVHRKAPAASAVLGDSGLIHGYIAYPIGLRSLSSILTLRSEIRRFHPQVLVYLGSLRGFPAALRDKWFFRFCGIPKIVGVPQSRSDCKRRRISGTTYRESEAERLARGIRDLGAFDLEAPSSWDLNLTDAELHRAKETVSAMNEARFLAVSLGTKAQANDWGEANWTALLSRLAAHLPDYRLAMVGADDEADACSRASIAWQERAINLCGLLTPRESAALFRSAELFIGHDSGPMHLAAAVGVPSVAVFSARNFPGVWFPHGRQHRVIYHQTDCAGCELVTCIEQQKKCILSITVDEVFDAVLSQLSRNPAEGRIASVLG
ncbi:ADP-heptose--lipooligosaccharide heptosyltransferase II [Acidisarcina polymorpha]|uniref:ADP-heptose--lipooligosaccharide heptosyltransferase II n=1 Tax=Acidisarcina polymorpha TaxID=2211140 RepID=A0A2Z5G2Z2_9BACT|nr:glycosyltransferase family 9 protein [Acidisarcina polymorpha]AXC13429.1 ADP-heptose--lipooligosaccharide heptosyltransferase II [Acidisarcina polymorpha]